MLQVTIPEAKQQSCLAIGKETGTHVLTGSVDVEMKEILKLYRNDLFLVRLTQ